MRTETVDIEVRKARMPDVDDIRELVMACAAEQKMLPRSLRYIYENLRNFFVCTDGAGEIVGCGCLQVSWKDLAEMKSFAVRADRQRMGVGAKIVRACLEEAAELLVNRVFVLSFVPEFFEKMGFQQVDKDELPHKVWTECVDCPLFPECGEVALVIDLKR